MKWILLLIGVVIAWSLWGYFSSRVEQAAYTVLEKKDGYEVRQYAPRIVAQTTVQGGYGKSLNEGFTIIAGYIFGGNTTQEKIAMTAPVLDRAVLSENIPMTAPVTATLGGESHVVSFVMPSNYTLETLPKPNDSRVQLVEVPEQKMAVRTFSWFWSEGRVAKMESQLRAALVRDGVVAVGAPQFAGYNAPWTPPWMVRSEVMVEIK